MPSIFGNVNQRVWYDDDDNVELPPGYLGEKVKMRQIQPWEKKCICGSDSVFGIPNNLHDHDCPKHGDYILKDEEK